MSGSQSFVCGICRKSVAMIVHYKLTMVGAPQGAMRVASQIWQVVFASQTLQVFCLALRKKAQYVVVNFVRIIGKGKKCHNAKLTKQP